MAGDVSECVLRCGVRLDLRQALHGIVSSISSQQWDLSQPPMQQSRYSHLCTFCFTHQTSSRSCQDAGLKATPVLHAGNSHTDNACMVKSA